MLNFWNFFIKNKAFSYVFVVALTIAGVSSVFSIPKESAPEIIIPMAIVNTVYPGATADDMEKLVTNKIEKALSNSLDDVKNITSTSKDSVSSVVVEFQTGTDMTKAISDVKDEVGKVSDLPKDSEDPSVIEINYADRPVMLISVSSDLPIKGLISLSKEVENKLESISGVSDVVVSGIPKKEVQVVVRKTALEQFGINLNDVVSSIGVSNSAVPVGNIELGGVDYTVKFEADIKNTFDIKDVAVFSKSGQAVYLRDIAFVSDGVSDSSSLTRVSVDGEPALVSATLSVYKRSGGDITKIAKNIREELGNMQKNGGLLSNSNVAISFDNGELVKKDLTNLSQSGLQTIILVMVTLILAIGFREAFVAGFAIPLSFLIAFWALYIFDNTINFISLFALILSVGILVDSAIVITEGIHTRIKKGFSNEEAVRETVREYHIPLSAGTMTTVAAFFPLFFISGIVGEFIKGIPFTVIFVLLASLFVALGILPIIASRFLGGNKKEGKLSEKQEYYTNKIQNWYKTKISGIVGNKRKEKRFLVGIVLAFIIVLTFPFTGFVKVVFFPEDDLDFLYINAQMPAGSTLEQTDFAIRSIEEVLYEQKDLDNFVTTIGETSNFDQSGNLVGERFANIVLNLKKDRSGTSSEILEDIRKSLGGVNNIEFRVLAPTSGPPVGAPVVINFFGDNFNALEDALTKAEDILKKIPGTTQIDNSLKNDSTEFVLDINREKIVELGLNPVIVAQTLRTAIYGTKATVIRENGDDIDVVVKLDLNSDFRTPHETNKANIDDIKQIPIITQNGTVLVGSLINADVNKGRSSISHKDEKRVVSITSEIANGYNARDILSEFEAKIKNVDLGGVKYEFAGENEESNQSFADMGVALIAGVLLMMIILILQFNSYKKAIFIVTIVPLSLIGIFVGLAITRLPLSFPSIMGFIALSGIVVNNSIILIDTIDTLRRKNPNLSKREAVIEGSTGRLRPIFLTTITTILGVAPLIFAAAIWAPLAFAIMFGLAFSVVITLVLVPVLYDRYIR